jgi:hypothetical protein
MTLSVLRRLTPLVFTLPIALGASASYAHGGAGAHTHETVAPADDGPVDEPPSPPPTANSPSSTAGNDEPPPAEEKSDAYAAPLSDKEAPGSYRPRSLQNHTWRQRVRQGESQSKYTDFKHFYVEMRFGPYSPEVDEEFDGAATPYADFFGDDPLFYFGLEIDWLPLYIPYVVSIGPGFGWGVTSASGQAVVASTGGDAGSETSLSIMPMHLSAVARFDGPLREMGVPIAPYIKAGLGIGIWSASGPNEDSTAQSPEGASYGMHLAIGASVSLNAFDPSAAMAMRENTGIRYANVWAEWMWANLDGIGSTPQMHVGTSTVVLGLALDF